VNALVAVAVGIVAAVAIADALRAEDPSSASPPSFEMPEVAAPPLSPQQEMEQIGNRWARLFAADKVSRCLYMTQPLCERLACERVGGHKLRNCRLPTAAFRKTFEGATVEDSAFKGNRGAARFSNGEVVEFFGDGGLWRVNKVGGDAGRGFFE
jgi:hypothetical protein